MFVLTNDKYSTFQFQKMCSNCKKNCSSPNRALTFGAVCFLDCACFNCSACVVFPGYFLCSSCHAPGCAYSTVNRHPSIIAAKSVVRHQSSIHLHHQSRISNDQCRIITHRSPTCYNESPITNHISLIITYQSPILLNQSSAPITTHQIPIIENTHYSSFTSPQSPITKPQLPIASHVSPTTNYQPPTANMTRHRVKSIDGIVLTHDHADAMLGLDDVRGLQVQHVLGLTCGLYSLCISPQGRVRVKQRINSLVNYAAKSCGLTWLILS